MTNPFHEGELATQERSGGQRIGEAVGRSIQDHMAGAAGEFLERLPFVVLGAEDRQGEVWSTYLVGEPGFARPDGDRTVVLEGGMLPGDPLADTLREVGRPVGIIGIEPGSRRRIRLNGRIESAGADVLRVSTVEVFANCPKYIQARQFTPTNDRESGEIRRAAVSWTNASAVGSSRPTRSSSRRFTPSAARTARTAAGCRVSSACTATTD